MPSAPLPGGRPPTSRPSRDQAAASSCAGPWQSYSGPRPPASSQDPGMLLQGKVGRCVCAKWEGTLTTRK